MTGTRIIFPAEKKQATLQFDNNSDTTFLVQLWLDKGNLDSTPETADAPFSLNPPIFRVNPNQGQVVRLFYTGEEALPNDRESIFYLNFKQIPSVSKKNEENRLVLLVKNRLKVFYRPKTIVGSVDDVPDQLNFNLIRDSTHSWLEIYNPTGYYATLTTAIVKIGSKEIKAKDVSMIGPKSTGRWLLEENTVPSEKATVTVRLINDYGAYTQYNIKEKKDLNSGKNE